MWDKIERVTPKLSVTGSSVGVICPRQGVETAARCRAWNASGAAPLTFPDGVYERESTAGSFPDLRDCDLVERLTDEYCAFPLGISPRFDHEVNEGESKGWTISFWIKSAGSTSLDQRGHFSPTIGFFASIAPLVPVAVFFESVSGSTSVEVHDYCTEQSETVPLYLYDARDPDVWTFVATTFDPIAQV